MRSLYASRARRSDQAVQHYGSESRKCRVPNVTSVDSPNVKSISGAVRAIFSQVGDLLFLLCSLVCWGEGGGGRGRRQEVKRSRRNQALPKPGRSLYTLASSILDDLVRALHGAQSQPTYEPIIPPGPESVVRFVGKTQQNTKKYTVYYILSFHALYFRSDLVRISIRHDCSLSERKESIPKAVPPSPSPPSPLPPLSLLEQITHPSHLTLHLTLPLRPLPSRRSTIVLAVEMMDDCHVEIDDPHRSISMTKPMTGFNVSVNDPCFVEGGVKREDG